MTRTEGMLWLVKAHPDLADPVAVGIDHVQQMYHRAQDQIHQCMACPNWAVVALIGETSGGYRFIDLCAECEREVIEASV